MRTDVPACRPEDRMPEVRERVRVVGWETCFVTNAGEVVLGRLGREALDGEEDVSAEEAMTLGPRTVRPSLDLDKAIDRMHSQSLTSLPVTHSDGVLVGVVSLDDIVAQRQTTQEQPFQ
jgi:Mg/Co/Ni transporter MgtE